MTSQQRTDVVFRLLHSPILCHNRSSNKAKIRSEISRFFTMVSVQKSPMKGLEFMQWIFRMIGWEWKPSISLLGSGWGEEKKNHHPIFANIHDIKRKKVFVIFLVVWCCSLCWVYQIVLAAWGEGETYQLSLTATKPQVRSQLSSSRPNHNHLHSYTIPRHSYMRSIRVDMCVCAHQ